MFITKGLFSYILNMFGLLIDFNAMSTRLGLSYAKRLGNNAPYMKIWLGVYLPQEQFAEYDRDL